MSKDECNSGLVMLSFLTGTLLGAAATLLLSPKTGKEVRALLADYSEELKKRTATLGDDLHDHTESALEQGSELIARGREMIAKGAEILSSSHDFLEDKKEALNAAIAAGREALHREKEVAEEKEGKGKKKGKSGEEAAD